MRYDRAVSAVLSLLSILSPRTLDQAVHVSGLLNILPFVAISSLFIRPPSTDHGSTNEARLAACLRAVRLQPGAE